MVLPSSSTSWGGGNEANLHQLSDGGGVAWLARLLGNRKERMLVSGYGREALFGLKMRLQDGLQ